MLDILNSGINNFVKGQIVDSGRLDEYVEKIRAHDTVPYTVVGGLMDEM
jgi:LAO/AO transport system kinase